MAYFDNPANDASWEQAMESLRAERQRRLSGEEPQEAVSLRASKERAYGSAERIPITFEQVEAEYRAELGVKNPERRMEKAGPVLQKEAQEMAGPVMQRTMPV